MRKQCCFTSFSLIFMILVFLAKTAYPSLIPVNIYGQVLKYIDEGGGSVPYPGAFVSIDFNGITLNDLTDTDGYYVIQGLIDVLPGQYTVAAEGVLCGPAEQTLFVTVGWDGEEEFNFDLLCGVATGSSFINGCVYDSVTESPIADCAITVWNEIWEASTISTLPNGCYLIPVAAGWWDITASREGYDSITYNYVFVNSSATVIRNFYLIPNEPPLPLTRPLSWLLLLLE